jgi:hypothetical protein
MTLNSMVACEPDLDGAKMHLGNAVSYLTRCVQIFSLDTISAGAVQFGQFLPFTNAENYKVGSTRSLFEYQI